MKVAFANSATQAKAWLASGAAETVARRQHQAGSVKKKTPKLNETLSCCISLYPPHASDTSPVGSEERKSAAAARDCSPSRMSNVLQAMDFWKLSQSSFEKLKNRNCCKFSFRMLNFVAAEEVTLWAFLARS